MSKRKQRDYGEMVTEALARRLKNKRQRASFRRIGRQLSPRAAKLFQHWYIPSSTTMTVSGGNNCTYDAIKGILTGPSTTATGDGFFSLEWALTDFPDNASYTTIFDQYRLESILVWFSPLQNSVGSTLAAGANLAAAVEPMETVIDLDDSNLLTSHANILEYDTYKYTNGYSDHKRKLRMRPTPAFYQSGAFSGYGAAEPGKNPWLDCASNGINHYGIKGIVPSNQAAADNVQCSWYVRCRAKVSFKNTH